MGGISVAKDIMESLQKLEQLDEDPAKLALALKEEGGSLEDFRNFVNYICPHNPYAHKILDAFEKIAS